jgi:tetratricopeptide (TPR) repeat protein
MKHTSIPLDGRKKRSVATIGISVVVTAIVVWRAYVISTGKDGDSNSEDSNVTIALPTRSLDNMLAGVASTNDASSSSNVLIPAPAATQNLPILHTPPFQSLRSRAAQLMQDGKNDEGIAILQSILDVSLEGFDRAEAGRMLAQHAWMSGQSDKAILLLEQALLDYVQGDSLHFSPEYGLAITNNLLASLYMERGEPTKAAKYFDDAIALRSDSIPEFTRIASLGGAISAQRAVGNASGEIEAIRRLIDRVPQYGMDARGARANRILRLAELEHATDATARLAAIDRLAAEPWMESHPARYQVALQSARILLAQVRVEEAFAKALAVVASSNGTIDGPIINTDHEQVLIMVGDRSDVNKDLAIQALRVLSQHGSEDFTREIAARRLGQLAAAQDQP